MSVRKGYIYALLLALGLLFWTEVWDAWQNPQQDTVQITENSPVTSEPWDSAEAVYECAMKARECQLDIVSMHVAADTMQGSMDVRGTRGNLQSFYKWLETEGDFRTILAFQFETADEANSKLVISYQL